MRKRAPRRLRCVQCTTFCDKCVEVCPNRANYTFLMQAGALDAAGAGLSRTAGWRSPAHEAFRVAAGPPDPARGRLLQRVRRLPDLLRAPGQAVCGQAAAVPHRRRISCWRTTTPSTSRATPSGGARAARSRVSPSGTARCSTKTITCACSLTPEFKMQGSMTLKAAFEGPLSLKDAAEMAVSPGHQGVAAVLLV